MYQFDQTNKLSSRKTLCSLSHPVMKFHAWRDEVWGSHIGQCEKEDYIMTPKINMGASEPRGLCNGDAIHNL